MTITELLDKLKYIGLITVSLIGIFGYWFMEKDFMYLEDAIEIEYGENEILEYSVGKFVRINNACSREISLFSKKDSQEKQVFAAISCDSEIVERTRLFVEVDNSNFSPITERLEKMETGELNLFQGKLKKLKFSDDEEYFFINSGVIFNETDSFLLKSDKSPQFSLKVFHALIALISISVLVISLVFYYFIDKPRNQ